MQFNQLISIFIEVQQARTAIERAHEQICARRPERMKKNLGNIRIE